MQLDWVPNGWGRPMNWYRCAVGCICWEARESNDPEGVAHVSQRRSPWNSGREERNEAGLCELRRQSHLALNGLNVDATNIFPGFHPGLSCCSPSGSTSSREDCVSTESFRLRSCEAIADGDTPSLPLWRHSKEFDCSGRVSVSRTICIQCLHRLSPHLTAENSLVRPERM